MNLLKIHTPAHTEAKYKPRIRVRWICILWNEDCVEGGKSGDRLYL